MSRESISDQVTMFELFTNVKEVADGQEDVVAGVDACMRHWSEMLRVSQDKEASLVTSIRNLQEKSSLDVEMCLEGLKRMWEFSKDRDLLQEMYSHASNGVRELQEDLMRAQERILKKASLTCVQRERKVARDAVEKAVRQAKLEAQALQNEMEKTQNELKAEKAVLTRQLQECTSELKNETKKVQELQTDVIVKANKISLLHEQIDSLKLRMQEEAASKQAEIEDKKKHISELLASLVQHQELQNHLSSDLKNTANELGHSRQATQELEKRLEAEVEMLSTKVQSLNAEIERLQAELNASSEEVHIVVKKHETVQRAVCETQKMLEDKQALYTMV
jgi:chromosome segregation ATPase